MILRQNLRFVLCRPWIYFAKDLRFSNKRLRLNIPRHRLCLNDASLPPIIAGPVRAERVQVFGRAPPWWVNPSRNVSPPFLSVDLMVNRIQPLSDYMGAFYTLTGGMATQKIYGTVQRSRTSRTKSVLSGNIVLETLRTRINVCGSRVLSSTRSPASFLSNQLKVQLL